MVLAASLVLVGCGSGDEGDEAGADGGAGSLPAVTGAADSAPQVADGAGDPPGKLVARTLSEGDGPEVARGDLLVTHYVAQTWTGRTFDSSWQQGQPAAVPIGIGQVIKGWDEALVGVTAGSRVEVSVPPDKGFGKQGNAQAGVKGTDTLVFVFDVLGSYGPKDGATGDPPSGGATGGDVPVEVTGTAPAEPQVSIPEGAQAPRGLVTRTLAEGNGPPVRKGQTMIAQYVGLRLDDGKTFDSSWQRGQPAAFPVGVGRVIPGWDEALVGVRAGSRVLLLVPPAKGYGAKGNPQIDVDGKDTLVFVVDVLGAHG
ncbi:MAG: FKBP-type peptidyl-prolyl cis-trans isomerase [Actinomycetes bacterium]